MGCQQLILLRPTSNSNHHLIGQCYVDGLALGELVLGSFPEKTRCLKDYNGAAYKFENSETGIRSALDPRLERLGIDLAKYKESIEAGHGFWLVLDSNTLRFKLQRNGVEAQQINLI
jgi:hypothetical protein